MAVQSKVNPFSTKFWASGVIPFQFLPAHYSTQNDSEHTAKQSANNAENLELLLERVRQNPMSQIVGPHGSGKTTLMLTLLKQCEKNGDEVEYMLFNDRNRQIPKEIPDGDKKIMFIDGIDQLPLLKRRWLLSQIRNAVLITHEPLWRVPVLFQMEPHFLMFKKIVRLLSPDFPDDSVLQTVYEQSGGNFRTGFFRLYDIWEEQCKNP